MGIRKQENKSYLCGKFLVDFLNEKSSYVAVRKLVANIQETFGCSVPDLRNGKRSRVGIESTRTELKAFFRELENGINLKQSKIISNYTSRYVSFYKPSLKIDDNGSLIEIPVFESGGFQKYQNVLVFCVVTLLKEDRNQRLIHRCLYKECRKYFMAKTIRKQQFCSDKCRMDWKYRKRIESQKH